MPTVLRIDGFRFFFYSNEGSPAEPVHIHVIKGSAEAKIWLEPAICLAASHGFNARQKRSILHVVEAHREDFVSKWHEHFSN